jgi:CRP/FNR family cyclic AMP-dependent transcriptional regulator
VVVETHPPRTELFRQGSPASEVFFLISGLIKLINLNEDGQELIFNLHFSGRMLAATSAVLHRENALTTVILTECQLYRIPAKEFCRVLRADNQLLWYVQQTLGLEVYEYINRLNQLARLTAQERFEQLLRQLIPILGQSEPQNVTRLKLPLKQSEIANLIAVTPEHLCIVLKRMEADGIIRREKGCVIIPNPSKLSSEPVI